jgi:3'-phosphoadenosine 5'-phosphosulfate sulfotransferase (PAPS reductase)/FAD synthetase
MAKAVAHGKRPLPVAEPKVRHILSLSGGKDSAALAIYMRDRVPEMEYIFHDTDKELPETYEFLARLEAILGKPIVKTNADKGFDHWLAVYGGMIPSNHRRWCTRALKLQPFERYIGNQPVINYVGLRADEDRTGYISHKSNITAVYPFREDGLVRADIVQILVDNGIGMPGYTDWGRTRSGCYFCFYQQKIEWVSLLEHHPHLFELAKKYEFANDHNGNPFYWSGDEPLTELERPERVADIKRKHEEKKRNRPKRSAGTLVSILGGYEDDDDDEDEGCLICSL